MMITSKRLERSGEKNWRGTDVYLPDYIKEYRWGGEAVPSVMTDTSKARDLGLL